MHMQITLSLSELCQMCLVVIGLIDLIYKLKKK